MRTITGIILGLAGVVAWQLSEPNAGESGDLPARWRRLKEEWGRATEQGKISGDFHRQKMQENFDSILDSP